MDANERAALVRAIRFEMKQNANDADEESRQDMGPPISRTRAALLRSRAANLTLLEGSQADARKRERLAARRQAARWRKRGAGF